MDTEGHGTKTASTIHKLTQSIFIVRFPVLRLDCLTHSASGKFVGLIHFNSPVSCPGLISICFRRADYFSRVSWEPRDTVLETIKQGLESLKSWRLLRVTTQLMTLLQLLPWRGKHSAKEESVTNCQILRSYRGKMRLTLPKALSGELCGFIFINILQIRKSIEILLRRDKKYFGRCSYL